MTIHTLVRLERSSRVVIRSPELLVPLLNPPRVHERPRVTHRSGGLDEGRGTLDARHLELIEDELEVDGGKFGGECCVRKELGEVVAVLERLVRALAEMLRRGENLIMYRNVSTKPTVPVMLGEQRLRSAGCVPCAMS